jgi:type I site-specific restriction-modification system R (restriction) subunit
LTSASSAASQEINLDYILELIFDNNKKTKTKADLVEEVRRAIRASLGNRAKESLLVDFINQTARVRQQIPIFPVFAYPTLTKSSTYS